MSVTWRHCTDLVTSQLDTFHFERHRWINLKALGQSGSWPQIVFDCTFLADQRIYLAATRCDNFDFDETQTNPFFQNQPSKGFLTCFGTTDTLHGDWAITCWPSDATLGKRTSNPTLYFRSLFFLVVTGLKLQSREQNRHSHIRIALQEVCFPLSAWNNTINPSKIDFWWCCCLLFLPPGGRRFACADFWKGQAIRHRHKTIFMYFLMTENSFLSVLAVSNCFFWRNVGCYASKFRSRQNMPPNGKKCEQEGWENGRASKQVKQNLLYWRYSNTKKNLKYFTV